MVQLNDLKGQLQEYENETANLKNEVKKLKAHKRVLKDEVVALRGKLGTEEQKSAIKGQALKNLREFFKKQTEGLNLHAAASTAEK